jgi:hypothetical protein
MASAPQSDAARPEFGPRGYLPERAARRARKIVLRAPLGLQWVLGALVAGAAVLVAGAVLLGRGDRPPGPPWVPVGAVAQLPDAAPDATTDLLLVTVGGRLRALAAPPGTAYCPATNRLEHPDGRVWAITGRGLGGTPSLESAPTLGVAGVGYVDRTVRLPGPEPLADVVQPGCAAG